MLGREKIVLSFTIALTVTTAVPAQRRSVPAQPSEVNVAIALQIAGQPYRFEGHATCQHAPVASIYSVLAERWSVEQSDGRQSLMLILWHPKNMSGDMFSLRVAGGRKSYLVNTVRGSGANAVRGSGKVVLTTSGAGGTFAVNATAENGSAITGTIKCSGFTAPVAEGG